MNNKIVLNLSLEEDELYKYFNNKSYDLKKTTKPLTEKIDKFTLDYSIITDIIVCNISTYDNSSYVSNYFYGSPYAICPEILRYIFQLKPKLFFITLDSNYIETAHFDNFKQHCSMVNYTIIEKQIEKSLFHMLIGINENSVTNLPTKIHSLNTIINECNSNKKNVKLETLLNHTISIFFSEGD